MPADKQLSRCVEEIFQDEIFSRAQHHVVRCGSLTLSLKFASPDLADIFLPSFLSGDGQRADLTVAVAGAKDVDLSAIVPVPRDKPRTFIGGTGYAVWQPGEKDVLSLLNFESRRAVIWLPQEAPPDGMRAAPGFLSFMR